MKKQKGYYYLIETAPLTVEVKGYSDRYRWVFCKAFTSLASSEKELTSRTRGDLKATSFEEREALGIGVGVNPTKVEEWVAMFVKNNKSPEVPGWRHRRLVSTCEYDRWDNTLHYMRVFDKTAYAQRVMRAPLDDYLDMRTAAPKEVGDRILEVEGPLDTFVYFKEQFNTRYSGLPKVLHQAVRKKEPHSPIMGESPDTLEVWPAPKIGELISFGPTPADVKTFKSTARSLLPAAFVYVPTEGEPRITFRTEVQINPGVFDIFYLLWERATLKNDLEASVVKAKGALIAEVERYIRALTH